MDTGVLWSHHFARLMVALVFLIVVWIAPIALCGMICEDRHRSVGKGILFGICLGWLAVIALAVTLRHRDPDTHQLIYS